MEISNAIIESVSFSNEKGLSAWLHLKVPGGGQSFGGYLLYAPKGWTAHNAPNIAGHFIWRCLEIAEVDDWSKLPGKAIRIGKFDNFGSIIAIGHIINDDWFYPEDEFTMLSSDMQDPE